MIRLNEDMRDPIPFNDLSRHIQGMRAELSVEMDAVLASGYYVLGPNVRGFEEEFATYLGAKHCVSVANGTDALEIAIRAVGVKAGDRVVVVANAAMYGTSAVMASGAEPVFVDVDPIDATIDPEQLRLIAGSKHPPKAVVVTHLYGKLARMDEILAIAREAGMAVVEDCAQAHGARTPDGRLAGSLGDVGCFSFYPTKNLGALGDGGALACNDLSIAERARALRQYGWSKKYTNTVPGGRNSRLDELQAAMLRKMLPRLDGWNARRRHIATRFSMEISNARIQTPPVCGDDYVGHLYVVRCGQRSALVEHLAGQGIQTDIHYPVPDHRQPCHLGRFASVDLPVTEHDADVVLSLPCFPELSDNEVSRIIQACNLF